MLFSKAIPHRSHNFWHFTKSSIGILTFDCCLSVPKKESICRHWLLGFIGIFLFLLFWGLGFLPRIRGGSFFSNSLKVRMDFRETNIHICTSNSMLHFKCILFSKNIIFHKLFLTMWNCYLSITIRNVKRGIKTECYTSGSVIYIIFENIFFCIIFVQPFLKHNYSGKK